MRSKTFQRLAALFLATAIALSPVVNFPGIAASPTPTMPTPQLDAEHVPGELIVFYRGASAESDSPNVDFRLIKLPDGQRLEQAMSSLLSNPEVVHVEPNYIVDIHEVALETAEATDPKLKDQWALTNIKAPEAWAQHGETLASATPAAIVAVVDTGVDRTHPDLKDRTLPGKNFARYKSDSTTYETEEPIDDNWHGTHVAGIINAAYNNGVGISGVAGPANVKVLPVKVLNDGGRGNIYDIAQGIIWSADQGAHVINLSLSVSYDSHALAEAIRYAQNKGGLIVAAVSERPYPCSYPGVIGVNRVNQFNYVPNPSARGPFIDLVAPGTDVLSTLPNASYGLATGTSMATPHVAAAAAMFKLTYPESTPGQISDALLQSVSTQHWWYKDTYGHGLLDVKSLLNQSSSSSPLLRFLYPQESSVISGVVDIFVEVVEPTEVDSIILYLNEVDHRNFLVKLTKPADEPRYSIYQHKWDSLTAGELSGQHRIIARAHHGEQLVGEVSLSITLRNEVPSGVLFQVLSPNGRIPYHTYFEVHEWNGESYELLWSGKASTEGLIRLPGYMVFDLDRYALLVYGEYEETAQQLSSFLYHRVIEGSSTGVIDGSQAQRVTLSATNRENKHLGDLAFYSLRVHNSDNTILSHIGLGPAEDGKQKVIYLDAGIYDFSVTLSSESVRWLTGVSSYTGLPYFLVQEEVEITTPTDITFSGAEGRVVRPTGPTWAPVKALSLQRHGWGTDRWPIAVVGTEVVVTPGTYDTLGALASEQYSQFYYCGKLLVTSGVSPHTIPLDGTISMTLKLDPVQLEQHALIADISLTHSRGYEVLELNFPRVLWRLTRSDGAPWVTGITGLKPGALNQPSSQLPSKR